MVSLERRTPHAICATPIKENLIEALPGMAG